MSQTPSRGRRPKIVPDLNRLDQHGYLISDEKGRLIDPMVLAAEDFDALLSQHVHLPDRVNWPLFDRYLALCQYGKLLGIQEAPDATLRFDGRK